MSTTATPFERLIDGLVPFLEGLRAAGYRLEVGQILAVHGLLATMAERGQVPADLRELRTILGPVLCAGANEQQHFARVFGDWVDAIQGVREAPTPPNTPVNIEQTVRDVEHLGRRAQARARPWIIAGAVLLAAAALGINWLVLSRRPILPPVTDGKETQTDGGGRSVGPPEPEQAKKTTKPGGGPVIVIRPPPPPPSSRHLADLLGGFAVFAAVVFEILATWWLVRRSSRAWFDRAVQRMAAGRGITGGEMVLRRLSADGVPELTTLRIRPEDIWPAEARRRLGRAAVGLRRHRRVDTDPGTIDVVATLNRALRAPDRIEPMPGRRPVTPEYLVLVHRVSRRDHQADWADALLDRLAGEQVALVRYEFATDPRVCYPRREPGPPWSLRDLATRYPEHRLLIFGDAACLTDPRTGRPAPWLDRLAAWEFRALLTPLPRASWGGREEALERRETVVEPATSAGLEGVAAGVAAAEGAATDLVRPEDGEPVPPLPYPLRTDPLRWLDPTPPLPEEADRLMADLRWYLKDDFGWLAACAFYPELRWDLTLELGRVLAEHRAGARMSLTTLARLVRLPWFRHGAMPDWLRLRLLKDLDPGRQEIIRRAIDQLLLGADRVDTDALEVTGPTLTIAKAAGGGGGTRGALARGIRRQLARSHPDSPLNDYVFATFLEGEDPSPLDFRLPAGVRALLDDGHMAATPGRPLPTVSRSPIMGPIVFLALALYTLIWAAVFAVLVAASFSYPASLIVAVPAFLITAAAHWAAMTLPGRAARGQPLTNLLFAPVVVWYLLADFLAAVASALVLLFALDLLGVKPEDLNASLIWAIGCLLIMTDVFRLISAWRADRIQTALRFYRPPLLVLGALLVGAPALQLGVESIKTVFHRPIATETLALVAGIAAYGLFFVVGPWLSVLNLKYRLGFVIPKPRPRRLGLSEIVPWIQANLRLLVVVWGAAAVLALIPYIYGWWSTTARSAFWSAFFENRLALVLGAIGILLGVGAWLMAPYLRRWRSRLSSSTSPSDRAMDPATTRRLTEVTSPAEPVPASGLEQPPSPANTDSSRAAAFPESLKPSPAPTASRGRSRPMILVIVLALFGGLLTLGVFAYRRWTEPAETNGGGAGIPKGVPPFNSNPNNASERAIPTEVETKVQTSGDVPPSPAYPKRRPESQTSPAKNFEGRQGGRVLEGEKAEAKAPPSKG